MPCIAHFHILKDALSLLVSCTILMMRHTFTRECAKEVMEVSVKSGEGHMSCRQEHGGPRRFRDARIVVVTRVVWREETRALICSAHSQATSFSLPRSGAQAYACMATRRSSTLVVMCSLFEIRQSHTISKPFF
jgi:hypothetical protein